MATLGFIGMGNMGYALLKGISSSLEKNDIIFTDINADKCKAVTEELGIKAASSNSEVAANAKFIVLAIKPQFYDDVIKNIKDIITADKVIISLAPNVSITDLENKLGALARVVRVMPNTPALIGKAMTGVCYSDKEFTAEEKAVVAMIFNSVGLFEEISEKLMPAVMAASSCSPAYAYMFIEALADGVVKQGLPRDKAYTFVAQMMVGAASMVLETGKHPGELKDAVCSPGGTTIEGVAALEEAGFRNAIIKACDACCDKCRNM